MRLFTNTFLFICGLLSLSVFAQSNPIGILQAKNPNISPYEILENLYNTSPQPAAFSNFDQYPNVGKQKCAGADSPNEKWASEIYSLVLYTYNVTGGPLLGGPRTVLIPGRDYYTGDANNSVTDNLQSIAAATTITATNTDMVVTVAAEELNSAFSGFSSYSQFLRKNGDYIVGKLVSKDNKSPTIFFYCWNVPAKKK